VGVGVLVGFGEGVSEEGGAVDVGADGGGGDDRGMRGARSSARCTNARVFRTWKAEKYIQAVMRTTATGPTTTLPLRSWLYLWFMNVVE
jgi:hypothetical protein